MLLFGISQITRKVAHFSIVQPVVSVAQLKKCCVHPDRSVTPHVHVCEHHIQPECELVPQFQEGSLPKVDVHATQVNMNSKQE